MDFIYIDKSGRKTVVVIPNETFMSKLKFTVVYFISAITICFVIAVFLFEFTRARPTWEWYPPLSLTNRYPTGLEVKWVVIKGKFSVVYFREDLEGWK